MIPPLKLSLAEREAPLLQALLDLVERLLAEVAHLDDLVFGHVEQLGDFRDAGPLEAVERADREVQRLDRDIPLACRRGRDRLLFGGETDEQPQLLGEDLSRLRKRVVRRDRAVGLYLQRKAVEVDRLPDAGVVDREVDLADRRED